MMSAFRLGRYSAAMVPTNWSATMTAICGRYGASRVFRIRSSMSVPLRAHGPAHQVGLGFSRPRAGTDPVEQRVGDLLGPEHLPRLRAGVADAQHERAEQQRGAARLHRQLGAV